LKEGYRITTHWYPGPKSVRQATQPDAQVVWYPGPRYQTNRRHGNTTAITMSTTQIGRAKAIPHDLVADIHLNAEYQVLVCIRCRTAVCPGALVEHLTRFHGMGPGRVRNRVREYIKSFPHDYDNTTVRTPADGTVPQAELASIRGWLCRRCGFRTKSKKRARTHANQEHALK
jgi:hypothetical protein